MSPFFTRIECKAAYFEKETSREALGIEYLATYLRAPIACYPFKYSPGPGNIFLGYFNCFYEFSKSPRSFLGKENWDAFYVVDV